MELHKLVVISEGKRITNEMDNVAMGFQAMVKKVVSLAEAYKDDYPNVKVACFDFDQNIDEPEDSYVMYEPGEDGEYCWNNINVE